jgi:hypothetical protein
MHSQSRILFLASLVILSACDRQTAKPVEALGGDGPDVSEFALSSLRGTRNGERLDVTTVYGDGSAQITVDLHFRVTPAIRLESGTWSGLGKQGTVRERSSRFLGGQSGPPSIGGQFDLLARDGRPLYRITIPLQPLRDRL